MVVRTNYVDRNTMIPASIYSVGRSVHMAAPLHELPVAWRRITSTLNTCMLPHKTDVDLYRHSRYQQKLVQMPFTQPPSSLDPLQPEILLDRIKMPCQPDMSLARVEAQSQPDLPLDEVGEPHHRCLSVGESEELLPPDVSLDEAEIQPSDPTIAEPLLAYNDGLIGWPTLPQRVKRSPASLILDIALDIALTVAALMFFIFALTVFYHDQAETASYPRLTRTLISATRYVSRHLDTRTS